VRDYHEAKKAALDGRSAPPGWPAAVSGRLLFIVFATGARQRRALGAWIDGARPPDADQPAAVQAGKPDRLAAALEAAPGDLVVVPLGVARLTKGIPRGPWPALRRGLRRRGLHDVVVVVVDHGRLALVAAAGDAREGMEIDRGERGGGGHVIRILQSTCHANYVATRWNH